LTPSGNRDGSAPEEVPSGLLFSPPIHAVIRVFSLFFSSACRPPLTMPKTINSQNRSRPILYPSCPWFRRRYLSTNTCHTPMFLHWVLSKLLYSRRFSWAQRLFNRSTTPSRRLRASSPAVTSTTPGTRPRGFFGFTPLGCIPSAEPHKSYDRFSPPNCPLEICSLKVGFLLSSTLFRSVPCQGLRKTLSPLRIGDFAAAVHPPQIQSTETEPDPEKEPLFSPLPIYKDTLREPSGSPFRQAVGLSH